MNLTARSVRGRQVQWVEAVEVSAMQHRTKMDYGARDLTGSSDVKRTPNRDCDPLVQFSCWARQAAASNEAR